MKTSKGLRTVLSSMAQAHQAQAQADLGPDFTGRVMQAVRAEALRSGWPQAGLWEGLRDWLTARFVLSLGGAALAAATLAVGLIRGLEADLLRSALHGAMAVRYLSLGLY